MTNALNQPEFAAFRATFLLQLSPPYRETLERLGQLLADFSRDLEADVDSVPDLPAEMAAVLADLRHTVTTLAWIGQHQTASELSPAERPVAEWAAHAATSLNRLIDVLEAGVGESSPRQEIAGGSTDRFAFDSVRARVGLSIPLPLRLAQQVGWEAGREVEWRLTADGLALHQIEEAVREAGPEA
jgi:hypothetical protein